MCWALQGSMWKIAEVKFACRVFLSEGRSTHVSHLKKEIVSLWVFRPQNKLFCFWVVYTRKGWFLQRSVPLIPFWVIHLIQGYIFLPGDFYPWKSIVPLLGFPSKNKRCIPKFLKYMGLLNWSQQSKSDHGQGLQNSYGNNLYQFGEF